jgi:S-DNA-T family DNA segregation ATPase FtsK/SpoIIIE
MAKKKKTKEESSSKFEYSVELTGLILILIGVIGFGFGPVGRILKEFAMFLLGEWWFCILILVLILGIYMLIKRKMPNFFTAKLLGIYLLIIVILVLSHMTFVKSSENAIAIFQNTVDNYNARITSISESANILNTTGQTSIVIGGGILGAIFSFAISSLFGITGTYIVLTILAIFGLVMTFNLNLGDILKKIFKLPKREKKTNNKESVDNEMVPITGNGDDEDKIIITSVEELKQNHQHITKEEPKQIEEVSTVTNKSNSSYHLPPLSLLEDVGKNKKVNSTEFIRSNKECLERVLNDFQINGKVVEIHVGPAITQYEVVVPTGTKLSRISSINKEIALALAAKDVRIEAPIPGKSTIGIEIPNQEVSSVKIKEVITKVNPEKVKKGLLVTLGKDITGATINADLTSMPHLLVAGSTGSGKSVCINSIIISLLMHYRPDEVKLVLVDPKQVELSNYNGIPHLMCPVVTDPKRASLVLQKVVQEMDRRYKVLASKGVKKISDYNEKIEEENRLHPDNIQDKMNYLVVIVDEMADLMIVARKEVEDSIMRITQLARAAGIHLIVATQRPSTDVITGVIKTNIPSRIAFSVASYIDSRTILDTSGAEKLLGKGDMLYLPMGATNPTRIQGCFISDNEIGRIIDYVSKQQTASYDDVLTNVNVETDHLAGVETSNDDSDDPLYDEIVEFAIQTGKISASLLQRRFRLGYNRAARIVDLLEERGIIGPQNGSKPREVLVKLKDENNAE